MPLANAGALNQEDAGNFCKEGSAKMSSSLAFASQRDSAPLSRTRAQITPQGNRGETLFKLQEQHSTEDPCLFGTSLRHARDSGATRVGIRSSNRASTEKAFQRAAQQSKVRLGRCAYGGLAGVTTVRTREKQNPPKKT
eukprot:scaffold1913_cov257-Pinguiococcus_pyrenoidosus.AAC.37